MPTIRFTKNLPEIQADSDEILMTALLRGGLPVASSCHGDGVCAKCRVRVVDGDQNLSPIEPPEARLRQRNRYAPDARVACQARVLGDVTVDTSYW